MQQWGIPVVAQRQRVQLGTMRLRVRSLASLSGLSVAVSCGVGRRLGSDPALLLLWCRPAAVALIRPLAWELPYAMGIALKTKNQNQNQRKKTPKKPRKT